MLRSMLLLAALFATPLLVSGCSSETSAPDETPTVDSASEDAGSGTKDEAASGTK